jgi:hypothetical protein
VPVNGCPLPILRVSITRQGAAGYSGLGPVRQPAQNRVFVGRRTAQSVGSQYQPLSGTDSRGELGKAENAG